MLPPFDLHRPTSVGDAVRLRRELGEEAALYAGGTELILAMKLGLLRRGHLIDVKAIAGLDAVTVVDGTLRIGAAVTHRTLERHPEVRRRLPALARLERHVANVRVRAQGTLAGNLAFAEPHADPPALLTALRARVIVTGSAGTRAVPMSEFLIGAYQPALGPDELVVAIEVPIPPPEVRAAYVKFQILERPSVGVAAVGAIRDGRFEGAPAIVVGAADETPRAVPAEALAGARLDEEAALEAAAAAARRAVEPVDDLAGSAEYKRHLVGVFTRRALAALAQAQIFN